MKRLIFCLTVLCVLAPTLRLGAQNVQARLDEALASYRSEDFENARFSLQEALNEINKAVGKEILAILPSEMNGLGRLEEPDNVTGMNLGFAGLFVHCSYQGENQDASIEIVTDSPMLAGINSILSMPGIMTTDGDQKRIKVDNYRALMTRNEDEEGKISWDVQVPFSSSLLTFQCSGIESEEQVVRMVNTIPVDRIVALSE